MEKRFDFTGISNEEALTLIEKWESELLYITSGARDRYVARQKLEEDLRIWVKKMRTALKEVGIHHKNTNYSSVEMGNHFYTVDIPYVIPYHVKSGIDNIEKVWRTPEDFVMYVSDWRTHNHVPLGHCKTVEEVLVTLTLHGLKS